MDSPRNDRWAFPPTWEVRAKLKKKKKKIVRILMELILKIQKCTELWFDNRFAEN